MQRDTTLEVLGQRTAVLKKKSEKMSHTLGQKNLPRGNSPRVAEIEGLNRKLDRSAQGRHRDFYLKWLLILRR